MSKNNGNFLSIMAHIVLYFISFLNIFLLSCNSNGPLNISSGISKENLRGNWICTYSRTREWTHDSLTLDTVISNDTGIFSIQFTDSLLIGINPVKDTVNLDTISYLFVNGNRLFINWFPPYFFGYVETFFNDSTLIIRDAENWERVSDAVSLNFWDERVYYFKKKS